METVLKRCCGLDVHKSTVVACLRIEDVPTQVSLEVRTFKTMTQDLLALGDWLRGHGVTKAAMEATGVYWKPVWTILEGTVDLMLVNPHHIKGLSGRKTDVKDCAWIADLLAHGLLKASFVPGMEQRRLRDLTRHRVSLVQDATRVHSRIQKTLEEANIKLASVASDVLGKSGHDMIEALSKGKNDPHELAELARGSLRGKIAQLREALEGRVTAHHQFMLGALLEQWDFLERQIAKIETRIEDELGPFEQAVVRLTTIPGVGRMTAITLAAEMGIRMEQFPTGGHLAMWAGMCPGNNQSGGKRKNERTGKGNVWLRRALCQAAWAASRSKQVYLASLFNRVAARRGRKRAAVAVGHSILVAAWHMLKHERDYLDLGPDFHDKLHAAQTAKRLVKRLERLGHKVTLHDAA